MASLFSHAIVGAAGAVLAPAGVSQRRLALGLAAAAVLPDIDVAAFALGIPYEHPLGHRGLTHGLAFAGVAGVVAAALVHGRRGIGARTFGWLALLYAAAFASHGLLDAATDGGLGVGFFVPFSDARFFLPWRPIAVSPISVSAFFGPWGVRVLWSELVAVWLPVAGVLGGAAIIRAAVLGRRKLG